MHPPEFQGLQSVYGSHCIYVESKEILLLIGGERGYTIQLTNYSMNAEPFGVWRYCLKEKKWTEMKKLSFNFKDVQCQLSADEKFIIITGGRKLWTVDKGVIIIKKCLYWI